MKQTPYQNSKTRNELFFEFCELVCPTYKDRVTSNHLRDIADRLDYAGVDFLDMNEKAKKYFENKPSGRLKGLILPEYSKKRLIYNNYRANACGLIEELSGIKLPKNSITSAVFYKEVLEGLVGKKRGLNFSKTELLKEINFLEIRAKKGIPNCVFGDIKRIENVCNNLKNYLKRRN
jgi:hypothetical protein